MEHDIDLIIVGGGVAGLTAGMYAAWHGIPAKLIDRMAGAGGCIVNAGNIVNFPGMPGGIAGPELGGKLAEQAVELGLAIEYGEVESISRLDDGFEVVVNGQPMVSRAVILATGSRPAHLGCPGEETFSGRGVSDCAVCDGPFFRDQPVVVIGGGDTAADSALHLCASASSVTLLVREPALQAADYLGRALADQPRFNMLCNTTVQSIEGQETVELVRLRDSNGRESSLNCTGVFVCTGLTPSTTLIGAFNAMDAGGHVPVDAWMRTTTRGLFAVGDIRSDSARQLVSAAGDGATAAVAVKRFLDSGSWP